MLAQPRPEIVAWMSFLAGQPLADGDIRAIASALFLEGPAAELTAIEARRVLRALTPLDTIGRASAWVALRSNIHAAEQAIGWSRVVNGVLHRHDPVLVPPSSFGDSVVTERSVRDWVLLRNLVTSLARVEQLNDVNGRLLRHALIDPHALPRSIPIRQRVGQAPIARAAIEAMLDGASAELAAGIAEGLVGLDPNDIEVVDQQIERLWLAAELKRLVRVARRH
ncbi:MAG: hypothetical protein AAFO29_19540 [Actinomycetota bacterium]